MTYLRNHRRGVNHPVMAHGPWVECTATDTRSLEPSSYQQVQYEEEQRWKQSKQLGYIAPSGQLKNSMARLRSKSPPRETPSAHTATPKPTTPSSLTSPETNGSKA